MSLAIAIFVAFVFLDGPIRFFIIAGAAILETVEISIWLRLRRVRTKTGSEGMIGRNGVAVTDCFPDGQVRVKGQLWHAHCPEGAAEGSRVIVTEVQGLRLHVSLTNSD